MNVISQSTSEYMDEIHAKFEKVKPFLDEGFTYASACLKAGLCTETNVKNVSAYRWFKDMVEYGAIQGYPYKDYKYRRIRIK